MRAINYMKNEERRELPRFYVHAKQIRDSRITNEPIIAKNYKVLCFQQLYRVQENVINTLMRPACPSLSKTFSAPFAIRCNLTPGSYLYHKSVSPLSSSSEAYRKRGGNKDNKGGNPQTNISRRKRGLGNKGLSFAPAQTRPAKRFASYPQNDNPSNLSLHLGHRKTARECRRRRAETMRLKGKGGWRFERNAGYKRIKTCDRIPVESTSYVYVTWRQTMETIHDPDEDLN